MMLRLWSDLYLIQGRYIVIMGTPIKASSLNDLNGLDVYPSLYGSSPLMSNRIIPARGVLTTFVLPVHNQGVGLAFKQDHCPQGKIPTDYQLILCNYTTDPNTCITAPFGGRSCNGHGCFVCWKLMLPFGQLLPDAGYLRASLMHHSLRLL